MGQSMQKRPIIVDLYAGVGGMSLGAARGGFDVRVAVELDRIAIETHSVNFPGSLHLNRDVATISGSVLLDAVGAVARKLDGLVGGPPCQGFSDIGKRAANDPRNSLFADFFRLVRETRPKFFVAENVPGILADRNRDIVRRALEQIPPQYVLLEPAEVAANTLGAPTSRARVFFVGYDPNEMRPLTEEYLFEPTADEPVTVGIALAGLPGIRSDWQTEAQGWRPVEFSNISSAFHTRLVDSLPPGVGCSRALDRLQKKREISGNLGTRHTQEVIRRFRTVAQGETDAISKAPRLAEHGLCPTLRAGTASDRGSFQAVRPIHYRSPRVISPREAARLQGFPDWFQFHSTKWHSFRQIGNSVSPVAAEVLL